MSEGIIALREGADDARAEIAQMRAASDRRLEELEARVSAFPAYVAHVRASADRAARRGTLRRQALRIVFLAHNKDAWDSIGEVVEIMRASEDFDPVVVSVPHHYGGEAPPRGEGRMHRFLTERGIPHLRLRKDEHMWAEELLRALDPDVVFRQSQWDADVNPAFSADSLGWTRLALIPYETVNPTRNVPWDDPPVDSALDQHWHRAAWLVFCANDDVLEIARHRTLTGGRQFRAVGHPKADALRRAAPFWPFADDAAGPTKVVWSAHHSILDGWNDFGMFPRVKDDMLRWAAEEPDTQFVFTHHPYLRGTIRRPESGLSATDFRDWLDAWNALPNTAYWRGAYAPVLASTDVVITDGPSMITEAQVLGKPTVFLERAEHIEFNDVGERLVRGVHRVADVAGARSAASEIFVDGDRLAVIQRENADHLFGAPGAAQRIVDTILAEARAEVARG
ncbi:hypothetical protein [Microbacterium flavum]|uniref:hypothetical protein n=1 Tax=Microbacterium flavum TaxID=415216 RepID=UPI0024AE50B0|nr:hypothetical protein [Microbacterium flavum]